jgi:hypothetical protein
LIPLLFGDDRESGQMLHPVRWNGGTKDYAVAMIEGRTRKTSKTTDVVTVYAP